MEVVPIYLWDKFPQPNESDGVADASKRTSLRQMLDQRGIRTRPNTPSFIERIITNARVIIIEGISGSGKDTLQAYLKTRLVNRVVYDYSEGEVLHSWKQFQIEGIVDLRLKFMTLFVSYIRDVLCRDENAVFLLNRFHLSTLAWSIIQQQTLGPDYEKVIEALRCLPVHVFILHVDEDEIEKRSLHPERSSAWQKFQQQLVKDYTFYTRLQRQQKLFFDAAKQQQLPFSIVKLPPFQPERGSEQVQLFGP